MRHSTLGMLLAGGILYFLAGGLCGEERVPLRINAGGGEVDGWKSDKDFVSGGASFPFGGPHRLEGLSSPAPVKVYETVRHREHRYRIRLANGKYKVRFHFVDGFESRDRKMNYEVEGVRAIAGFTPFLVAGGANRPVIVEVVTQVEDGALDIKCLEGQGNDVFEAGIEILAGDAGDAVTGEPKAVVAADPVPDESVKAGAADVSVAIREFAGAPVRLVWLQGDEGLHYTTSQSRVKVMVLDTEDGRGERELIPEEGGYSKPLITPDGEGVVFTDRKKKAVVYVPWSGGEVRDLGDGFASDVWRDPETGVDWIYLRKGTKKEDPIRRRRMDDLSVEEPIWKRTPNGHDGVPWFQLSADGFRFSDAFPWSKCGVGVLKNPGRDGKDWKQLGGGCWPGMAPDNSYRFWYFTGSHTDIVIFKGDGKGKKTISVNGMKGMGRNKVYFPRWSNDVRFITVAGPEKDKRSQLYLGKFAEDFKSMEGWVQVTNNDKADLFGDAWIAPKGSEESVVAVKKKAEEEPEVVEGGGSAPWPGSRDGLVFLWESSKDQNELAVGGGKFATCDVTLRGGAVPGRGFGMNLRGGWAEADRERADYVLAQCQGSGAISIEALVTPGNSQQGGPARIVTFSNGASERNFTLGQEGGQFVFRVRTSGADGNGAEFSFGELQAGMARHVLVSLAEGRLDFYLDGKQVGEEKVAGDLSVWKEMPLVFGDEVGGGRNWDGNLEAVAIRSRAVGESEAAALAAGSWVRLASRKLPARAAAELELLEVTVTPTLAEMGTYRRALVENVYAVKKVEYGKLPERIVVAEWAVLDGKPVTEKKEIGKVYRMILEPFSEHLELDGEFKSAGHLDVATERFYRIGR